jgi:hypothetical protein
MAAMSATGLAVEIERGAIDSGVTGHQEDLGRKAT